MSLHDFLQRASDSYYKGVPIIEDETFDKLAELCNYKEVGHKVEEGVRLPYRMYSLSKFYVGETEPPLRKDLLVETPKLDGAAIALLYIKGELEVVATRGDGITGKDISHLIPVLPVPKTIHNKDEIVQIMGEVVAPSNIPNARNYAAGALGLKDEKEFAKRDLYFAAYSIKPTQKSTYTKDIRLLIDWGFVTVLETDWSSFPKDGKVFRLDSNESFESMGYTAHHPRGAYALKERQQGVVTELLDVSWQVGKSGVVSPVAILQPVEIGGALVSRATLHNIAYIKALNLELGCKVEVIRSGEIIPRVVRRVL